MTRPIFAGDRSTVETRVDQEGPPRSPAPVGVCLLDRDLRYLHVNQALADINGMTVRDHIGRSVAEIMPDLAATLERHWRRAMDTGEPIENIAVQVAAGVIPNEAQGWSTSLFPLTGDDGTVTCVSVIVREVTEVDRLKQAAEETEGRYRNLVENSLGLICTHDLDGTLLSVNGAAAESLSYRPSELVGRNLADVLAPDARPRLQEYLQYICREGFATGLMRTVSKTGVVRFWSYRNVLVTPPGQAPYVLGHAMDVTDQRRAQVELREAKEQLEQRVAERTAELSKAVATRDAEIAERRQWEAAVLESEQQMRLLADSLPAFVAYVDRDERYQFVNRYYEQWHGVSEDQILGRKVEDILGPDLYPTIKPRIEEALAGHTVNFQSEGAYPDGQKRHTDATFVPRLDGAGAVVGFFSLVRDITSQVRAEEEGRRSWEEMIHGSRASTMGELAASLAHELNQPLSAILSNSQAALRFMDQETPDGEEVRDALGDIVDDARRAGEVIHRIRKLLRKDEMEREAVDINGVVEDVVCLLHSDTVARDIAVTLELEDGLPPVLGDAAQLQQVTLNLMMNACQAMSGQAASDRTLVVHTTIEGADTVAVAVEDNGPGVDPAIADQIFEPFVTSRSDGMGMGLSICRSIVEAHGGRLAVTPNLERGCTFRYALPVMRVDSEVSLNDG